MSVESQAAEFLKKYEGYVSSPIWDVNAWRIGYGSDTITNPDGSYRKVLQTDTTTPKDAQRDLERRISQEFIPLVIRKIGSTGYNQLSEGAKVALISIAYNYGTVPHANIRAAAAAGNEALLAAIWTKETYNDNKSLPENMRNALRARRAAEAALMLAGKKKVALIAGITLAAVGIYLYNR